MAVCLIGDAIVDVTMSDPAKMRLGGVFHAVRGCWAMGVPFHLLYIAPDYLKESAEHYALSLGALSVTHIGMVTGSPNVMVVREPTEAGNQGYEYLLRDEYQCRLDLKLISDVARGQDVLAFTGDYDPLAVLNACDEANSLSLDIANCRRDLKPMEGRRRLSTLFSSTSSQEFLVSCGADVHRYRDSLVRYTKTFVFKENRGGARLFADDSTTELSVGAQLRPIVHSIGVGDVFDVAFIAYRNLGDQVALGMASWIAAEYASTTYPDEFKDSVEQLLKQEPEFFLEYTGCRMSWEARARVNVYIAAPDFDYADRKIIDAVAGAVSYHNFRPRLPIRENGQATESDSVATRDRLFNADMKLLAECDALLAVILDWDPGTLVEIGLAAGLGKPTVVYDPFGMATNIMLARLPNLVTSSLDEAISELFRLLAVGTEA